MMSQISAKSKCMAKRDEPDRVKNPQLMAKPPANSIPLGDDDARIISNYICAQ